MLVVPDYQDVARFVTQQSLTKTTALMSQPLAVGQHRPYGAEDPGELWMLRVRIPERADQSWSNVKGRETDTDSECSSWNKKFFKSRTIVQFFACLYLALQDG